jgi:hypothetical protein
LKTSIFLSYPQPHRAAQAEFVNRVCAYLSSRGLEPRSLGVTDYDADAPLKAIRRLMLDCNGLITIALARTYIERGINHQRSRDGSIRQLPINGSYLTSPWSHIEAAMAYQIGLPVLIFREADVLADGLLEKGVIGTYMPEVNLDASPDDYFESGEWLDVMRKWEGYVRAVVENKGNPPRLY